MRQTRPLLHGGIAELKFMNRYLKKTGAHSRKCGNGIWLIGGCLLTFSFILLPIFPASAKVEITIGFDAPGKAGFQLPNVPSPSTNDAATDAQFIILQGDADRNGGGLAELHDGGLPTEPDEPARNFFFAPGTRGGKLRVDLKRLVDIKQVNTYSWHPSTRGPQHYKLYASDGTAKNFVGIPPRGMSLEGAGWKLLAEVDTRQNGGGQHGVCVSDSDGSLGKYRYLIFEIFCAETDDDFGNTFYSEIDVIENAAGAASDVKAGAAPAGKRAECIRDLSSKQSPTVRNARRRTDVSVRTSIKKRFSCRPSDISDIVRATSQQMTTTSKIKL